MTFDTIRNQTLLCNCSFSEVLVVYKGETARIVSSNTSPHHEPLFGVQFEGRGRFLWLTAEEIRTRFTLKGNHETV